METKTTNQLGLELTKTTLETLAATLRDTTSKYMLCADIVVEEAFKPVMKLIYDLLEKEEKVKMLQERSRQESKGTIYPDRVDMTFGEAIEALKKGYRVSRKGWNGKGMFLFLHERMEVKKNDKILASPVNTVEGEKQCVYIETLNELKEKNGSVKFVPVICMKAANDEVVVGWLASQTDMLSNDWIIIE